MDDEDLLRAIRASAKRARGAKVRPLDEGARDAIARTIARSFPPARARRRRVTMLRGGALAIALAAMLLFVMRPSRGEAIPPYELVASGGAADLRAGHGDRAAPVTVLHLRKGDRFEIVLRPPREVHGPIAARASLVREEEVVRFDGRIEIAREGAIRFEGDAGDFPGATPGAWRLVVTFGRPDALAGDASAERAETSSRQVREIPVILE